MTVSVPLPAMRRIDPDVLPQPFRMIDELFCEIVLCAMAEITAREDKHEQQAALQPREEIQPSVRASMEQLVTCLTCCPDGSSLLGFHDGCISVLGSNTTHSLDSAPLVCLSSAQVPSGGYLVAACTRETLHWVILDPETENVQVNHGQCPLNTIIPETSDSFVTISPCLRHVMVADGCSVSAYSVPEASSHRTDSTGVPGQTQTLAFKLSMTVHGPNRDVHAPEQVNFRQKALPAAYWRRQPQRAKPSTSSQEGYTTGVLIHWPGQSEFYCHSFCPPAAQKPQDPKTKVTEDGVDPSATTSKASAAGKDARAASAKGGKAAKDAPGTTGKGSKDTSKTKDAPDPSCSDDILPEPFIHRNVDTSHLGTTLRMPLPHLSNFSCMSHDGSSICFILANGCMLVLSTETLVVTALSPVIAASVKSVVYSGDNSNLLFVSGDGVLGTWKYKEFHQRVYGGSQKDGSGASRQAASAGPLGCVNLLLSHPLRLQAVLHASPVGVLDGCRTAIRYTGCGCWMFSQSEEGATLMECSLQGKQYTLSEAHAPQKLIELSRKQKHLEESSECGEAAAATPGTADGEGDAAHATEISASGVLLSRTVLNVQEGT